jgi:gamma-glutamyl:cysteine ligase YbdK (ATP-grasp superfamily)
MGVQITVQARDMEESRYLYDQLAVMAPIMMALSAASPIHKVGQPEASPFAMQLRPQHSVYWL